MGVIFDSGGNSPGQSAAASVGPAGESWQGPDFIIGGAARSGTTSLFRWLAAHPDVSMPDEKEIRFFDSNFENGAAWYARQFPDSPVGVVGEASPRYLAHPQAAHRIASLVPSTKMVFVLRDPVERAYSDYLMDRARGRGPRDFEEALDEPKLWARYVGTGHYAEHLMRFYEALSPEQVEVVLFDDLVTRPTSTFLEVCRFLGITEEVNGQVGRRVNPQVGFRSLAVRRAAQGIPGPAGRLLSRVNTRRGGAYQPMGAHAETRLREHFGAHNGKLAELLGRPVPWE